VTQQDRDRLIALKKAKKGLITQRQAAEEIGQSERHIRRFLVKLRREGDQAAVHALRGRQSNRKVAEKTRAEAVAILSRKLERWHKSLKSECIRPGTPLSQQDAERLIQQYVDHYNNVRLHSAIGYVTPMDMLAGRQKEMQAARDRKLEEARQQRQLRRQQAA